MASKKKTKVFDEITQPVVEQVISEEVKPQEEINPVTEEVKAPEETKPKKAKEEKKVLSSKFAIGDIVYLSKDAEADLNGFKLFPQYKKYTYTVEAYDADTDVYTLRRLNLSLRLKGELILAPNERAHDSLNRKQF